MSAVLELGSTGTSVESLQEALLAHGFSPGAVDGVFGSGTQQAVTAFQMSERMLADGIAGPRTQAALGLTEDDTLADATGGMTVQVASRMCPGAQLDAIKANLPPVLAALTTLGLQDRTMVLMAIATIRVETASFRPISEGLSGFNTSPGGHPFDLYDNRADLGNRGAPDGASYRGRGFVQLTGRNNYERYGPRLQPPVDLAAHPELANASDIAAGLLALFLKDRELNIKDALLHGNFAAARRLVNGGVHGIDAFTEAYALGDSLLS